MDSLLCLVAHPDDETILCGGALALLAGRGVAVHIFSLTRGEGGEVGEPPRCSRAELGQVREQEMACAASQLGAASLTFLGYVDPEVGPDGSLSAPQADLATLAGQVAEGARRVSAQVLLTHGSNGEYGHPAHRLAHQAARAALAMLGPQAPALYSFAAAYPAHPYPRLANADDPAGVVVDVSAQLERKAAAALCHATQTALFVRRRSEAAGRKLSVREVLLAEESFCRHAPTGSGQDPFPAWLAPAGESRQPHA